MLILRLRQAETALQDGRLDEAFEIARSPEVREHRRGQELIGKLARALVARGQGHLTAGRLPLATADGDKAGALAGSLPEIASLRSAIHQAAAARHDRDRRVAGAIGAAREYVRHGELSMGEGMLESLQDATHAEGLRDEAAIRRQQAEAMLSRAEEAMQREDWARASELLNKASQMHSTNPRVTQMSAEAADRMLEQARSALNQGRLEQTRCLLQWTGTLCATSVEYMELHGALVLCTKAAMAARDGRSRRVIESLQRVRMALPEAGWVADALAEAQRAAEATERLRGGPLGALMEDSQETKIAGSLRHSSDQGDSRGEEVREPGLRGETPLRRGSGIAEPATRVVEDPRGLKPAARCVAENHSRLMLHIDGVGSFLVLRDRAVTIGSAGGSRQPDVALLVDGAVGLVTIERADEDYFLTGGNGTTVNRAAVTRKLLAHGDRIGLGHRCSIQFSLPHAASTSALLNISGTRMPGTDATRVILLSDSLVIGPGSAAHVRCDDLTGPAVLHQRDGRWFCQTADTILVDGRPADRQAGLPLGKPVRIGPVSMVIRTA